MKDQVVPTYQYACTECGHAFEQFQNFSDDALTTCPQCEGRLRKLFNAVGVVFKGSGFYRTDSRAGASASVPASGASEGSGASASGESSKDSKPAPAAASTAAAKPSGASSSGAKSSTD
jgi:putative FmdB family regulatory protein